MAIRCDHCGKGPQYGRRVSHSHRRTPRRWLPNVHPHTLVLNGQVQRLHLCTRCLRTMTKQGSLAAV